MGNCNCVNHIEDQTFMDAVSIPNKFEQQVVDSELVDANQGLPNVTVQALVRSYIIRKRLNRKKTREQKSPKLNQVDLRLYIPQEIQNILKDCPIFEYSVTGDIIELPENQIFIGFLKSHDELTPGYLISPESYYKGSIQNMKYEGQGMLINVNGNIYIGGFQKGVFHGKGDFQSVADNKRYSGRWEAGQCNGQGTVINADGSVCKAIFTRGIKSGCGNISYKDGSNYSGNFKQDQINGIGKFSWSDGRVYEGLWKDGKMHGKGKLTYPDGRIYEGEFLESIKEGSGIYIWPDGKKYEGGWKSGKQHGIGVMSENEKKLKKGEWRHGKRIRWIE